MPAANFWLTLTASALLYATAQENFGGESNLRAYCQWEIFEASCQADEVILVTAAFYGRMQYGRCLRPEFGHAGCYSNVRSLADTHCSGRQRCRITVPDKLFEETKPCRDDLKMYLLISYRCAKALQPTNNMCRNPSEGPGSDTGLLASAVTAVTGCGSVETPWALSLPHGQRVNITLIDFTTNPLIAAQNKENASRASLGMYNPCRVYAIIKDLVSLKSHTVCGGLVGRERERTALSYLSDSNRVEVRLPSVRTNREQGPQFLLLYDAVGCLDVTSPGQVTWLRTGRNATIGCADGRVWHVTCQGRTWIGGDAINCSALGSPGLTNAAMTFPLSHVGASIVILVIAASVGLVVFIFGVCIIRRKRRSHLQRFQTKTTDDKVQAIYGRPDGAYQSVKWSNDSGNTRYPSAAPGAYFQHAAARKDTYESDDNEYAYVDELQLAPGTTSAQGYGPSQGYARPQGYMPSARRNNNAYDANCGEQAMMTSVGPQHDVTTSRPLQQYFTLKLDSGANSLPHHLDAPI